LIVEEVSAFGVDENRVIAEMNELREKRLVWNFYENPN